MVGTWGGGAVRTSKLEKAGRAPDAVRREVNRLLRA
ncbi:hypothetical protein [Streptomyces sp. NBC_00344]